MIEKWINWQIDYLIVLENFREITNHVFDDFFIYSTRFGEMIAPILVVCLIYWCISKKSGIYILFSILTGFILNFAIKVTACIYRPWILCSNINPIEEAMAYAGGYSFPSGHSTNATTVWGGISISFWNNPFAKLFLLIIPIVMFSRNYVGVHTPQDVFVGFIVGLVALFIIHKILKWEENGKNRDIILLIITTLFSVLLVFYSAFKSYPIDYVNGEILYDPSDNIFYLLSRIGGILGILWGWFIEKRFINFEIKNSNFIKKLLRFVVGAGILSILHHYLPSLLINTLGKGCGEAISFFILGFFITGLYPLIINLTKI